MAAEKKPNDQWGEEVLKLEMAKPVNLMGQKQTLSSSHAIKMHTHATGVRVVSKNSERTVTVSWADIVSYETAYVKAAKENSKLEKE